VQAGVWVVAAAGNEGPGEGTVGFPGGFSECLCVAALDQNLAVASFSSRGPAVDTANPGVSILSTYPGGRYARMSGTSMATPYFAGVLALYLDFLRRNQKPKPNLTQVLEILGATSKDLGARGKDTAYGYGLPQIIKMFDAVTPPPPPPPPPPPADSIEISVAELVKNGVNTVRISFVK
jgi:subtilisin family serine protease